MKMKKLGNTGLKVSEISLGTMSFGRWIDEKASIDLIDIAIENGINSIDTADVYGRGQDNGVFSQLGEAESIVGKALKGRRDQVVLATKVCNRMGQGINEEGLNRRHILKSIEDSLKRLQTDYIDIYYAHRFDPNTPLEETLRTFEDLVRQGKVRYIACSNFQSWQVAKSHGISVKLELERFEAVQPQYSLLVRDIEKELIPFCQSEQVGVIVYSPLARGMLSGKYQTPDRFPDHSRAKAGEERLLDLLKQEANFEKVRQLQEIANQLGIPLAQMALAWILHQPAVTSAIIGATKKNQLESIIQSKEIHFEAAVLEQINSVTK
ncbi:aldo/keto reductase [Ammoniphilus resinae]|uniref:Aryl-alcohol dehydrogenase-like predicted oxidoreductase n=1 Tax=Ammoniphilus resinae TaxID=861532 RepID=A0ABS4GWB7_9BACL|nr:aldo/keto reductase [Ammoniphilus resinae]MBP1934569.1 aryl-alcohol dehydrogenase-like predicted oxidoreductase [Ammoniphilus resinae]